ncbi:MAG: hypothetical protein GC182_06225 [Rhodopseudomonas sp.]|nr:hypothetical protein [Rhodopseudomonas sp.]
MRTNLTFLMGSVASVIASIMAVNGAQAMPVPPAPDISVQSYAELLEPVPNATALLQADDAARAQQPKPLLNLVQYYHHHHHGFFPGFGFGFGPPAYAYGDCHWELGPAHWNGRYWVRRRIRVCD